MARTQKIVIDYTPRPYQKVIHSNLDKHRWSVIVCHRRFGKTVMLVNHLIKSSLSCSLKDPRFHYCAPFLKQGKAIAWNYLKRFTCNIPGMKYNEAELRADFPNDARIAIIGADNAEGHRGIYSDGTVFDEYGNTDPQVFTSIFRPALSDRGGWAVFAGTPNGRNHFHELVCRADEDKTGQWYGKILKASETGVLSDFELEDARFIMSEEEYEREYECSFVSGARGAYYAKQLRKAEAEGRIANIPYDTGQEVYTFWDLGVDDSTTIWFMQSIGKEIRFIDYYENTGHGMLHYAKVLKEKDYNYGEHFMPHDAASKSIQTGQTTREYADGLGIRPISIVKRAKDKQAVLAGIEAGRNWLSQCYFDKHKCSRGLSALESYQTEWDESKKKLGDSPLHDWSSHACLPAGSKILLVDGYKNIEDVVVGDRVLLPTGDTGYVSNSGISGHTNELITIVLSNGNKLQCTTNHTLLTHLGLCKASDLCDNDLILTDGGYLWQLVMWYMVVASIISQQVTILGDSIANLVFTCTELFGKSRLVRYLKTMLSTIKIKTQQTTIYPTLSYSNVWNIYGITENTESGNEVKEILQRCSLKQESWDMFPEGNLKTGSATRNDGRQTQNCKSGLGLRQTLNRLLSPVKKLKSGTHLQKDCNGTKNTASVVGKIGSRLESFAQSVVLNTTRFILLSLNSAHRVAKKEIVSYDVIKPVYNLTVDVHNCYIANGLLVSNSDAFRTFAVGYRPKSKIRTVEDVMRSAQAHSYW